MEGGVLDHQEQVSSDQLGSGRGRLARGAACHPFEVVEGGRAAKGDNVPDYCVENVHPGDLPFSEDDEEADNAE